MKVGEKELPRPILPYHQALRSWFVLDGTVHSVEMCSSAIFLEFIVGCKRGQSRLSSSSLITLIETNDSSEARWFVLCELQMGRYEVVLYDSEQDAKNSQMSYTSDKLS